MEVSVKQFVPTNQVKATGNGWYNLFKEVEKIVEEHPGEEITLDFEDISVFVTAESNYATNIAAMPNVNIRLYNEPNIAEIFRAVAIMAGKSDDCIENVKKEIPHTQVVRITEKDRIVQHDTQLIADFLSKRFVMNGVMRIEFQYWKNPEITSIRSKTRADALRDELYKCIKRRISEGEVIKKVYVHTENFPIAEFALDMIANMTPEYRMLGCEIEITSSDQDVADRMKLRTGIEFVEASNEAKAELLRTLGIGRVGMLTKLKHRRSDSINLRIENVVVNQFIGIIEMIDNDEVTFNTVLTSKIAKNRWDEYYACSRVDVMPEVDTEYKTIKLDVLGLEHACLGREWHFNTFDGTAAGVEKVRTICNDKGGLGDHIEEVYYPEYVRRTLLAFGIDFDREKILGDITKFEQDCINTKKKSR